MFYCPTYNFQDYRALANKQQTGNFRFNRVNTCVHSNLWWSFFFIIVTVKRALAQRKVLLVTDGQSNNKQATIDSAKRLKNMSGVEIYVVAVGQYINGIDEMVKVATYPPEFNVYRVKKVSDLKYVIELALQKMNPSKYTAVKPPKPLCS